MKTILFAGLLTLTLSFAQAAEAAMQNSPLDARQEATVAIGAFAGTGNITGLKSALVQGLDAGLTVNQIKEMLVQVYAYAGFPRSLNALGAFMEVLDERQAKGIRDLAGPEPAPLPKDRSSLDFGGENQTKLTGQAVSGPLFDFSPAIDQFLKAHLFGDIFGRDNLDWLSREILTLGILGSLEGVNSQLQSHYRIAMHNGLTPAQARSVVDVITSRIGRVAGANAGQVLDTVLK